MLDEWLLTPIPSAMQRSRASLLVSPSSRASSYTRMFFGKWCPFLSLLALRCWLFFGAELYVSSHDSAASHEVVVVAVVRGHQAGSVAGPCDPSWEARHKEPHSFAIDGPNSLRSGVIAESAQAGPANHAPRPWEGPPITSRPSSVRVIRTFAREPDCGPHNVRTGQLSPLSPLCTPWPNLRAPWPISRPVRPSRGRRPLPSAAPCWPTVIGVSLLMRRAPLSASASGRSALLAAGERERRSGTIPRLSSLRRFDLADLGRSAPGHEVGWIVVKGTSRLRPATRSRPDARARARADAGADRSTLGSSSTRDLGDDRLARAGAVSTTLRDSGPRARTVVESPGWVATTICGPFAVATHSPMYA